MPKANVTKRVERNAISSPATARPPLAYDKFLAEMGIAPVTGWRMRNKGWIETVNIAGRHYVPHEAIVRFNERAGRGEFSRTPSKPTPKARTRRARKGKAAA